MAKKRNLFATVAAMFAALGAFLFSRSAGAAETVISDQPGRTTGEAPPIGASPLGLANNNPFNLEFRNIGWVGEIGTDGRFSIFDTAENGIRAGMINIHTKMTRDGLRTVRQLITRLSPAFENPTESFIQFVSRRVGVAADQPIEFRPSIIGLSRAIIQFENGSQPFSIDELEDALARTGRA
jgi:hypothetical protein